MMKEIVMTNIWEIVESFTSQEDCIAGICDAKTLPLPKEGFTPFVSKDINKRTNPATSLPGAQSIIVVGLQSKIENFPPIPEGAGIISALGITEDYHIRVRTLINKLLSLLQGYGDFKHKILIDSPALDERALAVKAGLGYIGKNGLVISKKYGSRFNIGLLLTDIPLYMPRDNIKQSCPPSCNKCIEACPSGALTKKFNVENCISYLTQKNEITPAEEAKIGRHLYGCDICQDVCPKNKPQPIAWAMPEDWLKMSDEEFAHKYGNTPMSWRSAKHLRRNAKIVIANRQAPPALPQN